MLLEDYSTSTFAFILRKGSHRNAAVTSLVALLPASGEFVSVEGSPGHLLLLTDGMIILAMAVS